MNNTVKYFIKGSNLARISRSGLGNNMSGIILFAKSQNSFDYLNFLYSNSKITETYFVILTREPEKGEGKIMVPLRKYLENNQFFMKIVPEYSAVYKVLFL